MNINREHFDQKAMAKVILVYGNFTKCIYFAHFVGFPHRNKENTVPALANKRVIPDQEKIYTRWGELLRISDRQNVKV